MEQVAEQTICIQQFSTNLLKDPADFIEYWLVSLLVIGADLDLENLNDGIEIESSGLDGKVADNNFESFDSDDKDGGDPPNCCSSFIYRL